MKDEGQKAEGRGQNLSPDSSFSIVIPILAGLGNSLMAMPMVRQIKRAFPGGRITILARSDAMAEPFRRLGEVDEVLITGIGLKALLRSIVWTRRRRPEAYLIPFPSNRWHYSLLALTSGARKKILHSYPAGYWRAMHFVGRRLPAARGIHDVIQNLRLLKLLGIQPDETEVPRFPLSDADHARADQMLSDVGVGSVEPFVAVHAGSGSYTVIARAKRWPAPNYARLIDAMLREFSIQVVLLEGPDESGVADEIVKYLPARSPGGAFPGLHLLKLAGPLGESAAILSRASIYVGSDSGLAHLAAAVGKRAVTIFAPANPDRVCPYGSRELVVQTPNSCAPCFTYPFDTPYTSAKCREPFCIDAVTVDAVLAAARRGLALQPRVRVHG